VFTLSTGAQKTAKHILIRHRRSPGRPDMPNAHLGYRDPTIFSTSKSAPKAADLSRRYIACEFACIMNGLGVE